MSDNEVKRGDVGVTFRDTLTAANPTTGAQEPLEGGIEDATVLFLLRKVGAAEATVSAEAEILDPDACTVRYVTVAGDLDVKGHYRQEWQATLTTGEVLTFPSDGYNSVVVLDDLGPPTGS